MFICSNKLSQLKQKIMEVLKRLETIDDIRAELDRVEQEEQSISRQILFNLTGKQEYYDIPDETTAVKSSAIEYNRITSEIRKMGSSIEGIA